MSSLLKLGAGQDVRRFAAMPPAEAVSAPAAATLPDPRDAELARMSAEIERLKEQREADAAASARAIEKAWAQGRDAGLAEAETRESDRMAALGGALRATSDAFAARLEILDALAPALVRAALSKLFDNVTDWSAPVEAMLNRQLAALRRGTLIAVRVSPQDFPDTAALDALCTMVGLEGVELSTDRELRAGASRIECRLGQIDLDVREQWQALSALLEEMAG